MKKLIKLVLVVTIIFQMIPTHIHANEELLYDQIKTIVENEVKSYASKINQSNANTNAAKALANHGLSGRGKKLSVGSTHALTATFMNSNFAQDSIISGLTDTLFLNQSLNENFLFLQTNLDYSSKNRKHFVYSKFMDQYTIEEIMTFSGRKTFEGKYNNYDNSLVWMGGDVNVDIYVNKKSVSNNKITYNIEIIFNDRFDFSTSSNDGFKNLISGIGAILFREFDWEAKCSFDIEIPNQCDHKSHNYSLSYDPINDQMKSEDMLITKRKYTQSSHSYYEFNTPIVLEHDKEWILEYTLKNPKYILFSQTPYLSKSYIYLVHDNNIFFHHRYLEKDVWTESLYGIKTTEWYPYKMNQCFTFKLENKIENNRNMIYCSAYSPELDKWIFKNEPLDNYFKLVNGVYIESDLENSFLSGKDYRINYLGGSPTYPFVVDEFSMKVWENGLNGNTDTFIDKITKQPTCLDKGSSTHTCERCGYTYTSSIKALGHTFSNYVDNGDGTSTSKCDRCDVTDTKVGIIYGDVNNDGKVNAQDRVYLTRYIARWDGYDINPLTSDVNCDEKINAQDRLILTRHISKWQGYESLPYIK